MFQRVSRLKTRKTRKNFVLLILQIHILILLLFGILFLRARLTNQPLPFFAIFFDKSPENLKYDEKVKVINPKGQEQLKN